MIQKLRMPFGKKSPLEALALPGVILAYKYSQFRQRRREAASRRVTERELSALHHKIDKLLSKLEESEPEPPTSQEDECVICINARATMQTSPCGHRVVCRRCFVKTIQSAVAQRLLPLRCVICRARVNRLTSSSGTWRIQESASSYSMGAKSWSSVSGYIPPSASSYSMGDARSGHPDFHSHQPQHNHVSHSASMYSMSSGTSSLSSTSNQTSYSKTSSASSGVESSLSSTSSTTNRQFLATPPVSGANITNHSHNHSACPSGCSGAVPRKQLSPSSSSSSNTTNTYPSRRHATGRSVDFHNRLPPIKEFRSPAKVPHPSPVHISNPRFRYSSYTKSTKNPNEMVPLLTKDLSPPRRASPATTVVSKQSSSSSSLGLSAKISPIISKNTVPKNCFSMPPTSSAQSKGFLQKKNTSGSIARETSKTDTINKGGKKLDLNSNTSSNNNFPLFNNKLMSNNSNINISTRKSCNSSNHYSFTTNYPNLHLEEKADNKKNESVERKKEEKLKQKAEKEARKEEKRLAKEEERMAKLLAKEEKKKGKKEAKEFLLANDGNNKK